MTRDEMIRTLVNIANRLVKNYSWDLNSKMWDLCCDWNAEHDDAEIFMSEVSDDDDNVIGFMIEDDTWYWN